MNTISKKEVANKYLQEVLNGHCVIVSSTSVWVKEFVKLCKKCKEAQIYRNFSPHNALRGEYSIHKTNLFDEIKVNEL